MNPKIAMKHLKMISNGEFPLGIHEEEGKQKPS
jgi:hypothetical protein